MQSAEEFADPSPRKSRRASARWRAGFITYDGWPAQEGGTDSAHHDRRTARSSLFQPAVTVAEAFSHQYQHMDRPPHHWTKRYPAWWQPDRMNGGSSSALGVLRSASDAFVGDSGVVAAADSERPAPAPAHSSASAESARYHKKTSNSALDAPAGCRSTSWQRFSSPQDVRRTSGW